MTDCQARLSIIVPVYNVEKWLERCLLSIYSQGLAETEFEVVAVNDGSTDNSVDILKKYETTRSNLRTISQNNGGLSAARNTGLRAATGKYVWFVDSDDWIESGSIREVLDFAERKDLDVVCFGLQLVFENSSKSVYAFPAAANHKRIFDGRNFTLNVFLPPAAWAAIHKRGFLIGNDIWFMEGILHEDMEFTPRAYCKAKRISFYPKVVYNYFQRSGSIMKSGAFAKKSSDLLTIADSLYEFAGQYASDRELYSWIMRRVHFALGQALSVRPLNGPSISAIKNKPYFPIDQSLYSGPLRKKYALINLSPHLFNLICCMKRYFCKILQWKTTQNYANRPVTPE